MTKENQQKISDLLKEKSELTVDLSDLLDPNYDLSFGKNNFLYILSLNCVKNENINKNVKDLLIKLVQLELRRIENELEKL